MKIEDVNKELQNLNIGSYSLVVDRKNKKMIVSSDKYFNNFEFMEFEVVCKEVSEMEEIVEDSELEEFDMDDFLKG